MSTHPLSPGHRVLDLGDVTLVDHMAGDHKVYGAARVSTGKAPEDSAKGEATDRKLIGYLMTNGHGSPFEHAVFTWFVKAPLFVVREWQRHRIASYNEQSGRYGEFAPEFYVPARAREVDPSNKQSSRPADSDEYSALVVKEIAESAVLAYDTYGHLLDIGVAREMARLVLPLNLYTRFWFTVNARSLMNFLALRNHPAAQWEIGEYARALESDFATVMPWTHAAFVANGRVAP